MNSIPGKPSSQPDLVRASPLNLLCSRMNNARPDFSRRSRADELMDQTEVSSDEIFSALKELNIINAWLGGHGVTRSGLSRLIPEPEGIYRVIDFGCGGGGNLRTVHEWAESSNVRVELTGIDLMPEAIQFSREYLSDLEHVTLIQTDYKDFQFENGEYDIALTSLFCHHLYDDDLTTLLQYMQRCASLGVILNDLHRHPVAYYSIKWITKLFSKSRLIQYDAPVSVAKAFTRNEFKNALLDAGISGYSISWHWAFRYLVTFR
ncbi:MAG: methyltransferase domain-containing protein [Candidatus Marinimicrobia bacterium]|nr:methyltransferase domain-containing protein [Candidatus Neomarinimicrobiota bacterium]